MGDLLIFMQRLKEVSDVLNMSLNSIKDILGELTDKYPFSSGVDVSSIEQLSHLIAKDAASCWTSVCELSTVIKLRIPWFSEDKSIENDNDALLRYLDGASPWSFWLVQSTNDAYTNFHAKLNKYYTEGALSKYTSVPNVSTYVICVDKKSVFRGLVLDSMADRVKVLNVDNGNSRVVKIEHVYYLTKDLCQPCAQIIHCSLTEDKSLEAEWNEDLKDLFKSVMRGCIIKINILKSLKDSFPLKHLVEMVGYNEEMDSTVDFEDWICGRLLPEISALIHNFVNISLDKLGEKALEPWGTNDEAETPGNSWSATLLEQPTATSVLMTSCDPFPAAEEFAPGANVSTSKPLSSAPSYSLPSTAPPLSKILSTRLENWENVDKIIEFKPAAARVLNVHSPTFEPPAGKSIENKLEETNGKTIASLLQTDKTPLLCENFSSKGFCLSSDCTKLHSKVPKT